MNGNGNRNVSLLTDGEQGHQGICVLVPGSNAMWQFLCAGRGRHTNFYGLSKTAPPELGCIDQQIWVRFFMHSLRTAYKLTDGGYGDFVSLFAVLSMLILYHFLPRPDDEEGSWTRYDSILFASFILFLIIVGLSWRETSRTKPQHLRKVASKMQPTFQAQGFTIEYVEPKGCCDQIFKGSWFKFTPNHIGLPQPRRAVVLAAEHIGTAPRAGSEDNNDLGTFNSEDWKPLEGKWELTAQAKRQNPISWILDIKSMVWTFENTSSEETFRSFTDSHAVSCYVWHKKITGKYKIEGNTLRLQPKIQPSASERVRKILNEEVYVPVPMEDRTWRSFYKKQQDTVMVVEAAGSSSSSATMKIFQFEFDEDLPSDEDLVAGALEHLSDSELDDMCSARFHFERRTSGFVPSTVVNTKNMHDDGDVDQSSTDYNLVV